MRQRRDGHLSLRGRCGAAAAGGLLSPRLSADHPPIRRDRTRRTGPTGGKHAERETRTLPVAVNSMLTFEQISRGPLSAAALPAALPALLLTLLAQRRIVAGLTAGGSKGA